MTNVRLELKKHVDHISVVYYISIVDRISIAHQPQSTFGSLYACPAACTHHRVPIRIFGEGLSTAVQLVQ